jgi:IS605 OrfB family transposase
MTNVVKIRQTTREIIRSFKRNDVRIQRELARKYWRRTNHRTDKILHAATNFIVDHAAKNGAALAIEDLTDIRKMYRKGNARGAEYRFRLNSWPYSKSKKMIEYKAAWNGVTIIQLTKSETYGSSSRCPTCGERLHKPAKGDVEHERTLWCPRCKVRMDRDVIAALNLSQRGRLRFDRSRPSKSEVKEESRSQPAATSFASQNGMAEGLAREAMSGNGTKTLILRVDASKLAHRRELKS